jgi:uncharacterized protein (DUF488 family)
VSPDGPRGAGRIFTIGHSTHAWPRFLELLRAHAIAGVADVRAQPGSRRHPHFDRTALERELAAAGIEYRCLPGLGGRRASSPGASVNDAWRDAALRAYADHTASAEFVAARAALEAWASTLSVAVMCAEGDPRRCHRQILADVLHGRGWQVVHVLADASAEPHVPPPSARFARDGTVTYPASSLFPPGA